MFELGQVQPMIGQKPFSNETYFKGLSNLNILIFRSNNPISHSENDIYLKYHSSLKSPELRGKVGYQNSS